MSTALAPSSRASYSMAWSAFLTFCAHNRIHPIPFNQDRILAFIVHAKEFLHLSPASIKSYISGIQYHYRIMSVPSPIILSIPVVCLTLRGILKSSPPAASSRLPILTDILHSLISTLRKGCFSPYEDLLMETICLTSLPSRASLPPLLYPPRTLSSLIPLAPIITHHWFSTHLSTLQSKPPSSTLPHSSDHSSLDLNLPRLQSIFPLLPPPFQISPSAARANINHSQIMNVGSWPSSAVDSFIHSPLI
ncbi:UNVERIFIED_CONTAM: hypothetical protein FKN15_004242 [Acipenser sinensis]